MSPLSGPVLAAAALLVISAIPKWQRPSHAVAALRDVGLAWMPVIAGRVIGIVEATVGLTVIVAGDRPVEAAMALLYLGFAAVLMAGLRRGARSCGCSGRADTPPTVSHLVLTLTFAGFGAGAAATGEAVGLTGLVGSQRAGWLLVMLVLVGTVTWFGWAVMSLLPRIAVSKPR